MSNFFYKYSDYASFQKAFRDTDGEDVVVDILSTDDSLKENEVVATSHVIRKDNRFSQESSFNKFFGPRKSLNRNFDMKDFSSWKNKNYRETEKQIGQGGAERTKFSFADFMNERSGGKVYNDADQNRSNDQKAINELSSEDPSFKKFSLNDYMRRLEEKTRVNKDTREGEDLIDSIGDITQDIKPDSQQDENFEESVSNINVEKIVGDEDFKGEKFAVDTSELDAMKSRLEEIKAQTEELNELIEDTEEDEQSADYSENEDDENISEGDFEEVSTEEENDDSEILDDGDETGSEEAGEEADESTEQDENSDIINPIVGGYVGGTIGGDANDGEAQTTGETNGAGGNSSGAGGGSGSTGGGLASGSADGVGGNATGGGATSSAGGSGVGGSEAVAVVSDGGNGDASSESQSQSGETSRGTSIKVININKTGSSNGASESETAGEGDKSQEIIRLISKNDQERHDIEEKLKQAEKDKLTAMKSYEARLKELEKSIEAKDKETQKRVLLEKIRNDNKLSQVRAEFKLREEEIRRLEKESALKQKIGALLKKELKNNLSISNLEMNNKLLETTSMIAQEKERAKANKPKVTRKRKQKRRIDSDIIGSVDFD